MSTQSDVFNEFMSCPGSPIQTDSSPEPNKGPTIASPIKDPVVTLARHNIRVTRDKMATRYNKQANIEVFNKGDIVLVKIPRVDRTAIY